MHTTNITREVGIARRKWYIIDAKDMILGRLCVCVANLLRGKNKPDFTPHQDSGDCVIVINSKYVRMTGNKAEKEKWYRHSGYPGGIKSRTGKEMIDKHSQLLIHGAVRRMLPKNKSLSKAQLHKLKIYIDDQHEHEAQQPIKFDVLKNMV